MKKGEYSADFLACKKMVQTYNAAFAGEQAMGVAHQGVQMGTTATNSKKLNKEIEKGQEGDVQDAGLTAARRTARTNRDIEASKIAFFGTKVAVLGGILAEWPTRNSLPKHCESKCADCCDYAAEKLYDGAKSDIFPNAAMKTAFTKEIIMTLGKTAQSALMMAEFNRQANIITDLKKKNKPVADGGGYEILVGLCEADPSDPQCQQGQGNRVDVDNGFNFGVGVSTGGSNNFGSGTDSSEEGLSDLGAYDAVPKGPVTPGAKLGQNDANNARDMLNAPSAASAGLGSPAGGGSGGGGAAGGGGGGGGGAARNPAAANGNSDSSGGNYNYKSGAQYGSGSYGTYVPSNGKGNNLGDMFGNKTASGGVDEVGRKIASEKVDGKDSNIWLKISGAHKKAVESNRLLHLK